MNGDLLVVGSRTSDATGKDSGAVYVFQRDRGANNSWVEVETLTGSDTMAGDLFGNALALDNGRLAVTALKDATGTGRLGTVYVFERELNGWREVARIDSPLGNAGNWFGVSVALEGEVLAVGAYRERSHFFDGGAVYIYQYKDEKQHQWQILKRIESSDIARKDRFGIWTDLEGDYLAIGAYHEDGHCQPCQAAGAVYVYSRHEGGTDHWGEVAKLNASDQRSGAEFGRTVKMQGNRLLVGSHQFKGPAGSNQGAVYIFDRVE